MYLLFPGPWSLLALSVTALHVSLDFMNLIAEDKRRRVLNAHLKV
jgi:hypothetical protein